MILSSWIQLLPVDLLPESGRVGVGSAAATVLLAELGRLQRLTIRPDAGGAGAAKTAEAKAARTTKVLAIILTAFRVRVDGDGQTDESRRYNRYD